MTKAWFVTISTSRETGSDSEKAPDSDQLSELGEILHEFQASVAGSDDSYGVVLKLEGDEPIELLEGAREHFLEARHKVGLPNWSIDRCEVLTGSALKQRQIVNSRAVELAGRDEVAHMLGTPEVLGPTSVDYSLPYLPLYGASEAIGLLGISRTRFSELVSRPDFPRPITRLAATPVWFAPAIMAYEMRRRKVAGRPPAASSDPQTAGADA
jgi:hypothetical protein